MPREPGKKRARRFVSETCLGEKRCRTDRADPETREREWMSREMQHRLQKLGRQFLPIADERPHQPLISAIISTKALRRKIDIAMETGRGAVIERMSQWDFRVNPVQAKLFERKRIEKRRAC